LRASANWWTSDPKLFPKKLSDGAVFVSTTGRGVDYDLGVTTTNPKQRNAKMVKQHEETIESHAKSNALMAVDQAEDYGGLEEAFHAFRQNTVDSCLEDGYSGDEAMDASGHFCAMFKKITGVEF
jgi:hypothetical protein